ncbi:hypothetical protein LTR59_004903 [Friedmanniomyces endolithicus]|nr:hypothetical protein LTR59_004903 [Friedmanniomyces endolithicus]KAK0813613.1 hypothetical protein LTR38_002962 [Friedmanniomyces endolithicus]
MVGYPFRTEPTTGDGGRASNAVTAAGGSVTADRGDKQSATTLEDAASKLALSTDDYAAKARGAGWTEKTAFDYDQYNRTGGDSHNWAGSAKKYEWKDEYGDVGPEVPELEQLLFGGEFQMRKGAHFENLDIKVTVEGPKEIVPIRQFDDAGLHPVILRNVELCGYDDVTPIQSYAIPAILKGHDLVAIAETGSGKTAAYMIPTLSRLMGKAKKLCAPKPNTSDPMYNPRRDRVKAEPLVVIVVPTRELAMQIFDEARRMCYRSMLRPVAAYGGRPMGDTCDDLQAGCDILIATPGRLCGLMDKPHVLTMSRVKFTIIDEADEMLNQDWDEELKKIMAGGDSNEDADHQYLMFSATFPKGARKMAREYMSPDFYRIRVGGRAGQAHKNIRQEILHVDGDRKKEAVYDLLMASKPGRTLIFCNAKPAVDLMDDFLYNRGLPTTSIHSDRSQLEREDALRCFRTGKCPILIATGLSARGWDIKGIEHVIQVDLPSTMYGGIHEYTHRIGRTGRIGHQGFATSFYNDRNEDLAQDLVNLLIESQCEVPDFLAHLKPEEGAKIDFDDDSDEEGEAEAGAAGSGGEEDTGGVATSAAADGGAVAAASGWGADTEGAGEGGFTADAGFHPAPAIAAW